MPRTITKANKTYHKHALHLLTTIEIQMYMYT